MPTLSLSSLSILLGLGFALPQLYGMVKPSQFKSKLRAFPRNTQWGYFLVGLATLWFLWEVKKENIADFAAYKKLMLIFFGGLGVATCVFVKDFLAVRGLAILMLLMAKVMLDTARWVDTEWRLIVVVWAYIWIIGGMWFTISPWRVRDIIDWKTQTEQRIRLICGFRFAFGLLIFILGITTFRTVAQ